MGLTVSLDASLITYNTRGLFYAPGESEEAFHARCHAASAYPLHSVPAAVTTLFDLNPDWVEVRYNNQPLAFWEGGCTLTEGDRVTLYLRTAFQRRAHYFGYTQEEIVAHELVHVVRGGWQEPQFEELLAYRTSPSTFRRFWGPLFRSPRESRVTIWLLLVVNGAMLCGLPFLPAYGLLVGWCGWGLLRLGYTQFLFRRAFATLSRLVGADKALAVMVRLTDKEITYCARRSEEEILQYAASRQEGRWKQIWLAYFSQIASKRFAH